jgi:ubiquinone/menaquinone biosynthesis C-methylase UbiE
MRCARPEDPAMHSHGRPFVPAAGADWLLPLYDPFNRLLGAARPKAALVDAAAIHAGDRVLDLGCGTGDVALLAKQRQPEARVVGLDPDARALARARAKAARAGVEIELERGFGDALPFADASFERVVSALMLHHLTPELERATLREVMRVLAPGGTFHVLDFTTPPAGFRQVLARLHGHGRPALPLLERLRAAGLSDARELAAPRFLIGSLSLCALTRGRQPASGGAPV